MSCAFSAGRQETYFEWSFDFSGFRARMTHSGGDRFATGRFGI
jgi:hypothetical protein